MPPAEVVTRITGALSGRLGDQVAANATPNAKVVFRDGMEPYPEWENVIQTVAANAKPFEVKFGKPVFLGDYVLALPIQGEAISQLHKQSVEMMHRIDTSKKGSETPEETAAFFESQSQFSPYITLATGLFGSGWTKRKLLGRVTKALQDLPAFTVSELALYEAMVFDRTYEPRGTIALGKPDARREPNANLVPILG